MVGIRRRDQGWWASEGGTRDGELVGGRDKVDLGPADCRERCAGAWCWVKRCHLRRHRAALREAEHSRAWAERVHVPAARTSAAVVSKKSALVHQWEGSTTSAATLIQKSTRMLWECVRSEESALMLQRECVQCVSRGHVLERLLEPDRVGVVALTAHSEAETAGRVTYACAGFEPRTRSASHTLVLGSGHSVGPPAVGPPAV
jgi:hypothetical protein